MTNIKHKLKHKYNAWLFKKYGFKRGQLFENVPTIYKIHALWSPSEYARCENDEISKCIKKAYIMVNYMILILQEVLIMSRAFKCDICGKLFEHRAQTNCSLKFPNKEKVQFCNLGLTKSFDICPDCMNTIQSTINSLNPSNNVDSVTIGCNNCKFGPVNTVDYMRCHKCTCYNLWEAKC